MTTPIEEYQAKIRYHYQEIDRLTKLITIQKDLLLRKNQ